MGGLRTGRIDQPVRLLLMTALNIPTSVTYHPAHGASPLETVPVTRPRAVGLVLALVLVASLALGTIAALAAGNETTTTNSPATGQLPVPEGATAVLPPVGEEPMLSAGQDVLVIGDSLALSTYPWLAELMPDREVTWLAQVGRGTEQSRTALEEFAKTEALPPILIVSSGTNDLDASTTELEAARILELAGPDRCVVWADVVRPESFGDGLAAVNESLLRVFTGRSNVVRVAWQALISAHPDWLAGDGIHPDQSGNQARARAFAEAAFTCSPRDLAAPTAARQFLPPSAFLAPGGSTPSTGPAAASSSYSSARPSSPRPNPPSPRPTKTRSPDPSGSAVPSPETSPTPPTPPEPSTSPPEGPAPGEQSTAP